MSTAFQSRLLIALGALILATPPLLVRFAPELPASADMPWHIPEALAESAPAGPRAPRIRTEPLRTAEHLMLQTESRGFILQRNTFSVKKLDDDLVPWIPGLSAPGWINVGISASKVRPWISVMNLQSTIGTSAQVLVWTYRVGPYLSRSFSIAKLLQVPAKLRGSNRFELVSITTPCLKDCEEAALQAAELLGQIVEANTEPR